jgi:hypothetical protein
MTRLQTQHQRLYQLPSADSTASACGLMGPGGQVRAMVLALGKPVEEVILENVGEDGDTRYYRDIERRHHVPKRKLDELIVN